MFTRIAMTVAATLILAGTALSVAHAGIAYHGGPKALSTVSINQNGGDRNTQSSGF